MILFNLAILWTIIILSRIKQSKIRQGLRKLRYLLLLSFIFQAVLTSGEPLFYLGSVSITREGINLGFSTIFRLMILYLSSSLLTMTTSPLKLASGVESLLSPFNISEFLSTSFPCHQHLAEVYTTIEEADRHPGPKAGERC